jgi:hypothetical protein
MSQTTERSECCFANEDVHTYRFRESETPTETLVHAVAAHSNQGVDELQPLSYVIDADALDKLIQGVVAAPSGPLSVEFTYEGYEVCLNTMGVGLKKIDPDGDSDRRCC